MEHILDDINFDNNPVVVGVSSGPDSMCLLNLLEQKTNRRHFYETHNRVYNTVRQGKLNF